MHKYSITLLSLLIFIVITTIKCQETYTAKPAFPEFLDGKKSSFAPSFSPDGKTFYFTQMDTLPDETYGGIIYQSKLKGDRWGNPTVASFSGVHDDYDAFPAPDGKRLFFMSRRPVTGTVPRDNIDLWVVDAKGDDWGKPEHLGDLVNTNGYDGMPSVTKDGTLYFFSDREGGYGKADMYRSKLVNGEYTSPENLGPVINTAAWEGVAYISPDERILIFYSSKPNPKKYGRNADLYVSYNENGKWTEPENLGPNVNTINSSITPHITPDKKYLYFGRAEEDNHKKIFYINIKGTPIKL